MAGISAVAVALALSLFNVNGGGTFSYDATNVYAGVTGSLSGAESSHTFESIDFDSQSTSGTVSPTTWQNIAFNFVNDDEIVFTINFQNKSTEKSMYVQYTDNHTDITNVTFDYKVGTNSETTFEVEANTTKSLVITMNVTNLDQSVSGTFNFEIKLSNSSFS